MLVLVKTPDIGSLFLPFNNLLYVLLQLLLLEGHTADKLLLLRMCPLEIKSIYIYIYIYIYNTLSLYVTMLYAILTFSPLVLAVDPVQ